MNKNNASSMIEICYKYNKDLGLIPKSLLLIDKYENLVKRLDKKLY